MNVLQRLILKQVWKQQKAWEGFMMCCQRTMPQSFPVLFQLPIPQLKALFAHHPEVQKALQQHISSLNESQRVPIPNSIVDVIFSEIPASKEVSTNA